MSPIAVGLDLLLAALLLAALALGARLNARLKALRDSHAGFAKAVGELDAAAARAQVALAGLRAASEEAHDDLLKRIETARALSAKLERTTAEAQKVVEAAGRMPSSAPSVEPSRRPLATDPVRREALPPLELTDRIAERPPARRPLRSIFDDELFESGQQAPRRAGGDRR